MDLQALTCPHCSSTQVVRAADGTFRCQNCNTRLLLIDKVGRLVIPAVEGWLDCPKCGTVNEAENFFCTQCGTAIRYQCPTCGTVRLAAQPVCGVCGQSYHSAQAAAECRKMRRRTRNRSIITGCFATAIVLSLWMLVITTLDWENNEIINAVATVLCCISPFTGLGVGAATYVMRGGLDRDPSENR